MRWIHRTTPLVLLAVVGCASTQGRSSGSQDLIERQEIVTANVATAYEAIQQLRPMMLNVRGRSVVARESDASGDLSSRGPVVYLDGVRHGDIDSLRGIAANDIHEIRFIDGSTATMRWGTGHGGGVIHVRTQSGG